MIWLRRAVRRAGKPRAIFRSVLALLFVLGAVPAAAQTPVPALPLGKWVTFADPTEGAFSMEVPAGWRVSGGIARRNALQFWPWLTAVSPEGTTVLAFGDPYAQSYILPTPMLAATGFSEGRIYDGGGGTRYVVSHYVPGLDYAVAYGGRQLPRFCTEIRLAARRERADMAALLGSTFSRSTAGEARFTCREGQMAMQAYVFCATSLVPWGYGAGIWYASFLFGYLAPQPLAGVAEQMVAHMLGTIRVNRQWLAMISNEAVAASRIAAETGRAISDNIMKSWEAKNASIDRIMEERSRAQLGIDVYTNPATGERYVVPNTHEYVWANAQGRVVGTDTDTAPPGFTRLQPAPPGS